LDADRARYNRGLDCSFVVVRPVGRSACKQVGDTDHLKVFANADAAETWFEGNDPEGVAFEYEVLE
jgi:hypothetical protein